MAKRIKELLDALDIRLAKGEISEETYKELKAKYSAKLEKITGKPIAPKEPVITKVEIQERMANARHTETICWLLVIFLFIPITIAGIAVLTSYISVTHPYEDLGILLGLLGGGGTFLGLAKIAVCHRYRSQVIEWLEKG